MWEQEITDYFGWYQYWLISIGIVNICIVIIGNGIDIVFSAYYQPNMGTFMVICILNWLTFLEEPLLLLLFCSIFSVFEMMITVSFYCNQCEHKVFVMSNLKTHTHGLMTSTITILVYCCITLYKGSKNIQPGQTGSNWLVSDHCFYRLAWIGWMTLRGVPPPGWMSSYKEHHVYWIKYIFTCSKIHKKEIY